MKRRQEKEQKGEKRALPWVHFLSFYFSVLVSHLPFSQSSFPVTASETKEMGKEELERSEGTEGIRRAQKAEHTLHCSKDFSVILQRLHVVGPL